MNALSRLATARRAGPLRGRRAAVFAAGGLTAPVLLVTALALWVGGLRHIDPATLSGWGLIRALPVPVGLSYPVLVAAAVIEIRREQRRNVVLAAITLAAVVMIYGLQPAVEGVARLETGWLHAGFSTYIATHGHVLPDFDARFSWPGFFALIAMVCEASGGVDPTTLLNWAPPVFIALSAVCVGAIAAAVMPSSRAAWLATWVFLAGDWTEQDYFSPQAIAYLLMLAAMAVTLRYLVSPGPIDGDRIAWRDRSARPPYPAGVRIAAQLIVLTIVLAIAPTHQLTPYALVGLLVVLVAWRRLWPRWLAVLALVPPVVWLVVGAQDFWAGNIERIVPGLGAVRAAVSQGVTNRLGGDLGHQVVTSTRIGITLVVAAVAVAGYMLRRRQGHRTWTLAAMAASPFGLALLQPYGGEIFIRSYLFALPWLAIGAAIALEALLTARWRVRYLPAVAVGVVLVAIAGMTVFVRGGNDAYVGITAADVRAVDYVYAHARPGDAVVAPLGHEPLRFDREGDLLQGTAGDTWMADNAACMATEILPCLTQTGPAWVLVNPQQSNAGQILNGWPPDWMASVVNGLLDEGYDVVFSQGGSIVLHTPRSGRP
jgi:hypothetical protein